MLTWIAKRSERKMNAHNFYGSIVALSRNPDIYARLQVPDTVECRFEIMVLHMFVCLERLSGEDTPLAQDIVDMFFADMDTTSRELGVGDMVVPKKMRGLAAVFEERMAAYKAAVEAPGKSVLANELRRNLFSGEKSHAGNIRALALYLRQLRQHLTGMPLEQLVAGQISAPDISRKKP